MNPARMISVCGVHDLSVLTWVSSHTQVRSAGNYKLSVGSSDYLHMCERQATCRACVLSPTLCMLGYTAASYSTSLDIMDGWTLMTMMLMGDDNNKDNDHIS